MSFSNRRTPKNYDGTRLTTHRMVDLLPTSLKRVGNVFANRPDQILAAWPEIIGSALASMTQAIAFQDGVLSVKVKNSTLHSLLNQRDKHKILQTLRNKFPQVEIKNIFFRIG